MTQTVFYTGSLKLATHTEMILIIIAMLIFSFTVWFWELKYWKKLNLFLDLRDEAMLKKIRKNNDHKI